MDLKNETTLANAYFPNKASKTRIENEYYPTAPIATLSLLKNYNVPKSIWEAAAGRGHISKELIRNGHEVYSSDLYTYENPLVPVNYGIDFLTEVRHDVSGVITNPPFKDNLPEKLIRRMLIEHEYEFLALFVRLTFMESARRYKLFADLPPTKILVSSERIQCHEEYMIKNNGIGGMVSMCWIIWDRRHDTGLSTKLDWFRASDYINDLQKED